jgi:ATP-dependent Zn protease
MQVVEQWFPLALTLGLMGAIFYFMRGRMGGGGGMDGLMNIGKSGVTKINKGDIKTRFKDVAGCDEVHTTPHHTHARKLKGKGKGKGKVLCFFRVYSFLFK